MALDQNISPSNSPKDNTKKSGVQSRKPRASNHPLAKSSGMLLIGTVLAIAVFLIYAPVQTFRFVDFDDEQYVFRNTNVLGGLTWKAVIWAFTSTDLYYWQPLTWMSHMLDIQLFGVDAGPHHMVNVALHAANAVLLFLLLDHLTGSRGRSALVSAIFCLHPLRVESVAWVAERKDLLSAFFGLLTLWIYVNYAQKPSMKRYLLLLAGFTAGLMAKPLLVTLPFVLLVLDYWPLRRWRPLDGQKGRWWLIGEKIPMLLLAGCVALLTVKGQRAAGAIPDLPWTVGLGNAAVGYVEYVGMIVFPHNLAVLYPYRSHSIFLAVVCGCAVIVGTGVAFSFRKRRPYLFFGWLWFVIALLPMAGFIQAGPQAVADRFTYLPSIGIILAVVWWVEELTRTQNGWRRVAVLTGIASVIACSWLSANQLRYWRNSKTLFLRAAEIAPRSAIVQHNLGYALAEEGNYGEALAHYRAAVALDPELFRAHYNLGRALYEMGYTDQAIAEFKRTLQSKLPIYYAADVHSALGISFIGSNRVVEAGTEFRTALAQRPGSPEFHANFASFLARTGHLPNAVHEYRAAIQLWPGYGGARLNLARALADLGQRSEAIAELRTVLAQEPANKDAQAQIAKLEAQALP